MPAGQSPRITLGALVGVALAFVLAALDAGPLSTETERLFIALLIGAALAGITSRQNDPHARWPTLPGSTVCVGLACGLLPGSCVLAVVACGELSALLGRLARERRVQPATALGAFATHAVAATVVAAALPEPAQALGLTGVVAGYILLGVMARSALRDPRRPVPRRRDVRAVLPAAAAAIVVTAGTGTVYFLLGALAAYATILGTILLAYLQALLDQARSQAERERLLAEGTLQALVATLASRSAPAARHAAAVGAYARDIAATAGLTADEQRVAHLAGLLHDVGMFAVPDEVLQSTSQRRPLTPEEWSALAAHPVTGSALLRPLELHGPVSETVRHHHERVDGRGYPDGLAGAAIPLLARIVTVAEAYDTLTGPDTYREPVSSFHALRELRRAAGSHLDAEIVEHLAQLLSARPDSWSAAQDADLPAELAVARD